jgi:hypothetical protein
MHQPAWVDDGSLSEAELTELILDELGGCGWRVLKREALGTHRVSGDRLRVDALLEPPGSEGWHEGSRCFAFEAKRRLPEDATDHAGLVVQAVDYRDTEWDDFGHLPVIVWPEPFGTFLGGDNPQGGAVARAILSKLRVLPLRWVERHGWWLGLNMTRVWSAEKGPSTHAGRWDLRPTWGHQ